MKRAALFTLSLAGCALQAAESAFSASFGEYSPGEALGEKGVHGGTWRVTEDATATNVVRGFFATGMRNARAFVK